MNDETDLWLLLLPYLRTDLTVDEKKVLANDLDCYCDDVERKGRIRGRECIAALIKELK